MTTCLMRDRESDVSYYSTTGYIAARGILDEHGPSCEKEVCRFRRHVSYSDRLTYALTHSHSPLRTTTVAAIPPRLTKIPDLSAPAPLV